MRKIQLPVTLDGAARKKDDSVSLRFVTNLEVSTEDFMTIDTYRRHSGWLLFRENEFQDTDVPKQPAPEKEGKSLSQRLYNVLFVLYSQKYPDGNDFENWRSTKMEGLINRIKEELI